MQTIFEKTIHLFGDVEVGSTHEFSFQIKGSPDDIMYIDPPSCSCTAATYTDGAITGTLAMGTKEGKLQKQVTLMPVTSADEFIYDADTKVRSKNPDYFNSKIVLNLVANVVPKTN